MIHRFGGYDFEFVEHIRPKLNEKGKVLEYKYDLPDGINPNRYAVGPFCEFGLLYALEGPGVYIITVDNEPAYLGECKNLSDRFGPKGYGYIYARNCHHDGQSTNCKVNSLVLKNYRKNKTISLWFYPTPNRKTLESQLIQTIRPQWNEGRTRPENRDDQGGFCGNSKY